MQFISKNVHVSSDSGLNVIPAKTEKEKDFSYRIIVLVTEDWEVIRCRADKLGCDVLERGALLKEVTLNTDLGSKKIVLEKFVR